MKSLKKTEVFVPSQQQKKGIIKGLANGLAAGGSKCCYTSCSRCRNRGVAEKTSVLNA